MIGKLLSDADSALKSQVEPLYTAMAADEEVIKTMRDASKDKDMSDDR